MTHVTQKVRAEGKAGEFEGSRGRRVTLPSDPAPGPRVASMTMPVTPAALDHMSSAWLVSWIARFSASFTRASDGVDVSIVRDGGASIAVPDVTLFVGTAVKTGQPIPFQ